MSQGSKFAIYAAAGGNLAIAASKVAAFGFTGSSAMLTEGIHSLVDTGNQGLLLLGIRRAALPPNARHPFGYGMELYFWSFVVALMIFAHGGAFAVYEGVLKVQRPEPIERAWINFLVLGVAIAIEAMSFAIASRENRRRNPRARFVASVRASKDPSLFAVMLEDAAALAGLLIAFAGVGVAVLFDVPEADGVASILIGLLLTGVAAFMANETRSLLTGESAAPEVLAEIRHILQSDPRVAAVVEVLSLHLGPSDILVGVTLHFQEDLVGGEVSRAATELSAKIRAAQPSVGRLFMRSAQDAEGFVPLAPPSAGGRGPAM